MSDSLQSLVDRAAFLSAEVQQSFGSVIAEREFEVDFSSAPTLRFTGDQTISFRPHMMGSSVSRQAEKTWHWAWDNINEFPEQVVALSARVREHGSARGIAELSDAELPLDPENLPLALTLASKAITGAWAHYPVAAGGGTTVWVLIDDERLTLGEPELKPVVRALASGITGLEVSDHRIALASYATLRGLRTAPLPDGGVRILCADGSADVTFDEQERISSCQANQTLEGEAAEQFAQIGAVTGTAVFGGAAAGLPAPVESAPAQREPVTSAAPEEPPAPAPAPVPAEHPAAEQPAPVAAETPAAEARPQAEQQPTPAADEPHEPSAEAPSETETPPETEAPAEAEAPASAETESPAETEAPQEERPQKEKKGLLRRLFGR
ncbi:DUF6882 domain-containing protein [Brevibacterium jeotgali]|uniref:Uncharacterized protein n=1 Tax=Brevibacterium jeotgali TaxID=1262550 RepID=A0A2H1L4J0_9MICO|nr:DUF6882 domain-containing protein [Brevibacterium jeotgali]TWB98587.1 hypothetical protein FB108_2478 [Brevibacterium jeotgali]SMY11812.1 hypothetical protein BJEO58_01403 [Brevibacterium jeotgali]